MLKISHLFILLALTLVMAGCTSTNEKHDINDPGALDIILCQEPRPQVCTREYDPVCAKLKDGSIKTAATGCTSCSDPEVVGYSMGACGIVSLD